jgi:hypothetical protein
MNNRAPSSISNTETIKPQPFFNSSIFEELKEENKDADSSQILQLMKIAQDEIHSLDSETSMKGKQKFFNLGILFMSKLENLDDLTDEGKYTSEQLSSVVINIAIKVLTKVKTFTNNNDFDQFTNWNLGQIYKVLRVLQYKIGLEIPEGLEIK